MLDRYIVRRYTIVTEDDITAYAITADVIMEVSILAESSERGALTEAVFYILLSLFSPMHGYGIMQNVRELSNERVDLGAGTLYGAINTLLEKNWIKSIAGEKDSRKKEYQITDLGKSIIQGEIVRLEELIINGKRIIGGGM
jgi:DNA-binding PadR family transcriptional regulator